jgi:putative PIN family toxin of toxin-antitoxin system
MINVVLDTNILVSAALTPKGTIARMIDLIINTAEIQIYYSNDILAEYMRVLSKPKLKIAANVQIIIINAIIEDGILINPTVSNTPLPHEPDRVCYDLARGVHAILITANLKHFPTDEISATSPTDFLNHSIKL